MKNKILNELDWYSRQTINTTFQQIAKEFKKNQDPNSVPSITEISQRAFTTPSSVTRFCNQLGYKGYKEFSNRLAFELEYEGLDSHFSDTKNHRWTSEYVFNLTFEKIIKDFRRINVENFSKIVNVVHHLLKQKNVFIISSSPWGIYFYDSLMALGINTFMIQNQKLFLELFKTQKIDETSFCLLFLFDDDPWISECWPTIHYNQISHVIFSNKKNLVENGFSAETILVDSSNDPSYDFQDDLLLLNYLLNQILKLVLNKIKGDYLI